jgi:hypothetical protein
MVINAENTIDPKEDTTIDVVAEYGKLEPCSNITTVNEETVKEDLLV